MNLEELRAIQADERAADSLQPLTESFYRDVSEYLTELRNERERVADKAADPFGSDRVRQLTDEIETVEEVVEAVLERRVGKVMKRASLTAAGMAKDEDGLTAEETALYHDLVEVIESHRSDVLEVLSGDESQTNRESYDLQSHAADPDETTESWADDSDSLADQSSQPDGDSTTDAQSDESQTPDPPSVDYDRITIRVTTDVGEVFGIDERTYELHTNDVVTLPRANAEPLLDRGAADRID